MRSITIKNISSKVVPVEDKRPEPGQEITVNHTERVRYLIKNNFYEVIEQGSQIEEEVMSDGNTPEPSFSEDEEPRIEEEPEDIMLEEAEEELSKIEPTKKKGRKSKKYNNMESD